MDKLAEICERFHLDLVVGFGSAFDEDPAAASDVDLAVRVAPGAALPDKLDLLRSLAAVFGDKIDLVIINELRSETLRFEIFKSGKPLFAAHPDLFHAEVSLAIRRYADTAWLRERNRKALRRKLESLP